MQWTSDEQEPSVTSTDIMGWIQIPSPDWQTTHSIARDCRALCFNLLKALRIEFPEGVSIVSWAQKRQTGFQVKDMR